MTRFLELAALTDAAYLEEARAGGAAGVVHIGGDVEDVFQLLRRALHAGLGHLARPKAAGGVEGRGARQPPRGSARRAESYGNDVMA